jgi:diguanylate cyclase (GGDEF)-like protein
MREILQMCIELDRMAYDTYRALAQTCEDEEFVACFTQMAKEERTHVEWWSDLLVAWEAGLVPDIADEHGLLERLTEIGYELELNSIDDCRGMSPDDVLDLAVKFEFYLLDPIFGELLGLVRPGSKIDVNESYSRHVLRLVELIERRYTRPGLSSFLAGVLRRAYRDQQRLASLSMHDQLTGLYNRRGLLGHLTQWLSWSKRYGRPLGVVLVDVDHFKTINDRYGHEIGDRALEAVADALTDAVRSSDTVGRFGGDEFVVLAPETDGAELEALMERLIAAVAEHTVLSEGERIELSVSTGGAWATGGVEVSAELLIAQADRSMYEAKGAGRNRSGVALSAAAP